MALLGNIGRIMRWTALAVAVAPSSALAEFEPSVPLTGPGLSAEEAEVVRGPVGYEAALVFLEAFGSGASRIYARRLSAEGVPGPLKAVSPADLDANDADAVLDDEGDAQAIWEIDCGTSSTCMQTGGIAANGAVLPVQNLTAPISICTEGQVARGPEDSHVFVYRCAAAASPDNHRIKARTRSAGGALGATLAISPASGEAYAPSVVTDGDGDALFVWLLFDGVLARVQARTLSAGGTLGAIQNITPPGSNTDFPEVDMTPDGRAALVWQRYNGADTSIETRRRLSTGALGAIVTLSATGEDGTVPQLALDAAGNALFVWQGSDRIQSRHRSTGGVLRPIQNISNTAGLSFEPQVARNADGNAVFIWSREDGSVHRVQTRTRSATGALGAIETLSSAGFGSRFPQPHTAIDDDGGAVAVWTRFNGTTDRIWAAHAPPP